MFAHLPLIVLTHNVDGLFCVAVKELVLDVCLLCSSIDDGIVIYPTLDRLKVFGFDAPHFLLRLGKSELWMG